MKNGERASYQSNAQFCALIRCHCHCPRGQHNWSPIALTWYFCKARRNAGWRRWLKMFKPFNRPTMAYGFPSENATQLLFALSCIPG